MSKKYVYQAVAELSNEEMKSLLIELDNIFNTETLAPALEPRSEKLQELMDLDYHTNTMDKMHVVYNDVSNEVVERFKKS